MAMLPRDIIDLCGIKMGDEAPAPEAHGTMDPALSLTLEGDGTYTLTYRGEVLGWIDPVTTDRREGNTYRAVTTYGNIRHCYSLTLAKAFLIETTI